MLYNGEKPYERKEVMYNDWKFRLKQAWNQHPLECILVASIAVTAVAKLIDARSASQGRRAYARQVDYRVRTHR
jgi:hypothetical protein